MDLKECVLSSLIFALKQNCLLLEALKLEFENNSGDTLSKNPYKKCHVLFE